MFNILAHQPNDLGIQIGPVAPVILGMLLAPDLTSRAHSVPIYDSITDNMMTICPWHRPSGRPPDYTQ